MPLNKNNIISSFNTYFNEKDNFTKKEFLEFAKKTYDENSTKGKKIINKENVEKKPLNAYQNFMKEQRVILNKRENERTDGEKKKSTELMKEIAELWKIQKSRVERKEMFVEDAKPNEKKLNIINEDVDDEAKIISKAKKVVKKSKKAVNNSDEDSDEGKKSPKSKKVNIDNSDEDSDEGKKSPKSKKVNIDNSDEDSDEEKKSPKSKKVNNDSSDEESQEKNKIIKSRKQISKSNEN